LYERVEKVYSEYDRCEKTLDEANKLKRKYKVGCQVYDGFI